MPLSQSVFGKGGRVFVWITPNTQVKQQLYTLGGAVGRRHLGELVLWSKARRSHLVQNKVLRWLA
jgi:hypothetical protein